jgi:hypothetical protein
MKLIQRCLNRLMTIKRKRLSLIYNMFINAFKDYLNDMSKSRDRFENEIAKNLNKFNWPVVKPFL